MSMEESGMKTEQRQSLKQVMNSMEGVELKEKRGGKFHFPLYMTKKMSETLLEALALSVRSNNALKRAGFRTIGDLAKSLSEGVELKSVRNCGAKSIREIMEQLFLYQYYLLRPEHRADYLLEVVAMNEGARRLCHV